MGVRPWREEAEIVESTAQHMVCGAVQSANNYFQTGLCGLKHAVLLQRCDIFQSRVRSTSRRHRRTVNPFSRCFSFLHPLRLLHLTPFRPTVELRRGGRLQSGNEAVGGRGVSGGRVGGAFGISLPRYQPPTLTSLSSPPLDTPSLPPPAPGRDRNPADSRTLPSQRGGG